MRFPRSKLPPFTTNAEAAALIRVAADRCGGCRVSWRLHGWRHGQPLPIECTAKAERQALRDIAKAARLTEAAA